MRSNPIDPNAEMSEEREPIAGFATVPIWLIVLLGVLGYWGQLHLDKFGGEFDPRVYGPFASLKEVQKANPDVGVDMVAKGREIYSTSCAPCHQFSGQGLPGQFPPLSGSEWVVGDHPGRIIRIVLDGLQGPIEVKGQQFNNVMVPWRPRPPDVPGLKDDEIAAVLTFVRQEWGNKAPPVKPEDVKAIREKTKERTQQWTANELLKENE